MYLFVRNFKLLIEFGYRFVSSMNIIFHISCSDLLQNPLIVPVKRLQYHESFNDFGIFEVMFHPQQPWLFSTGADATVRLYT